MGVAWVLDGALRYCLELGLRIRVKVKYPRGITFGLACSGWLSKGAVECTTRHCYRRCDDLIHKLIGNVRIGIAHLILQAAVHAALAFELIEFLAQLLIGNVVHDLLLGNRQIPFL